MTDLRKGLELVEVEYTNDNKRAILKFLDMENGELLEVNFNKQAWVNGEYVDDEEKAVKVDEWCQKYFDTTFDDLASKVGETHDVYKYEKFNSLWEVDEVNKFDVKQKGQIFTTNIESISDTGQKISIRYKVDGDLYETKYQYADYVEQLNQFFPNPQKKLKQYKKFKDLFGVDVENADEIIGKEIMVEVKVAFGKFAYGEIKKPNWNK